MKLLFKVCLLFTLCNTNFSSFAQGDCNCNNIDKDLQNHRDSLMVFNVVNKLKTSNEEACLFEALDLEFKYYLTQLKFDKTLKILNLQEDLLARIDCEKKYVFQIYLNKAQYYRSTNDLEKLSDFAFKALREAERLNDSEKEITAIKEVVNLFTRMRETHKNWPYVKRAEKLITGQNINQQNVQHYRWLAFEYETKYTQTGRKTLIDSSLLFIKKARKEAFKYNMNDEIALFYRVLEATSYHKGELQNALKYIDSAIYYGKKIKGEKNLASFYLAKSWDHLDLGELNEAVIWMDTALYYDKPKGSAANMMMYKEASEIYENAGQLSKAYESFRTYSKIKDSILNLERVEKINELETKYQTELKDAKIRKLTLGIIVASLIILAILFIAKMAQLRKAKLTNKALQDAINAQTALEKELTSVREHIAQDFHDDLGNKLARISLFSTMVEKDMADKNSKISSKIKQITEDSNSLYRGTRDFIFSLKESSDYIEELVTYISDFGEDYYSTTSIKFKVDKKIEINKKLPYYWSKQLIYIFKEAMTNALKHSECTEVTLKFTTQNNQVTIECNDNGSGMEKVEMASNNGLQNMRQRAEKIGGELIVKTIKSSGTSIIFNGKTA